MIISSLKYLKNNDFTEKYGVLFRNFSSKIS